MYKIVDIKRLNYLYEKVYVKTNYDNYLYKKIYIGLWLFPEMGVPQNGWLLIETLAKIDDDWGYPYFLEPPTYM